MIMIYEFLSAQHGKPSKVFHISTIVAVHDYHEVESRNHGHSVGLNVNNLIIISS